MTITITPEKIKKAIIDEDDFGHEMRVGQVFSDIQPDNDPQQPTEKRDLVHGWTYTDPSLGKPRQFDYRCQMYRFDPGGKRESLKCVSLAVECKNLHASSPLVVCGRPRINNEAFHNFIVSSEKLTPFSTKVAKKDCGGTLYNADSFVGKSYYRLKCSNETLNVDRSIQSDIYDRWSQAVQSAADLAEEASLFVLKNKWCKYSSTLVLPVVVLPDKLLWRVTYGPDGKISEEPTMVEQCEFFIGKELNSVLHRDQPRLLVVTHIHFVTIKGFAELLSGFLKRGNDWRNWDKAFPYGAENMK